MSKKLSPLKHKERDIEAHRISPNYANQAEWHELNPTAEELALQTKDAEKNKLKEDQLKLEREEWENELKPGGLYYIDPVLEQQVEDWKTERKIEKRQVGIIKSHKSHFNDLTNKHKKAIKDLRVAEQSGDYSEEKLANNDNLKIKYNRIKVAATNAKKAKEDAKLALQKEEVKLSKHINKVKNK